VSGETVRSSVSLRLAVDFVGAFAKFRKATISFVISVRPFACTNLVLAGWIFVKFDI
jgi:hypothetical protein